MYLAVAIIGLGFLPSAEPTTYDTHQTIVIGQYDDQSECERSLLKFWDANYQTQGVKGNYMAQMLDGFCLLKH